MKLKSAICLLPCLVALATCNILNCEFDMLNLQGSSLYTCIAKNINLSIDNAEIVKVLGSHAPGKSNADVQAVKFTNSNGAFIVGLGKFFYNLKLIDASQNGFNYIEGVHFKGLRSLEVVNFRETKISTLFRDTFVDNPLLKFVSFFSSQISAVENGFLDSLPSSTKIAFGENPCIPGVTGLSVAENRAAMKNSCKLPYPLGEKLQSLENDLEYTRSALDVTTRNLTISLLSLNELNRDMARQIVDPTALCSSTSAGACLLDLKKCNDALNVAITPVTVGVTKGKCNYERDAQSNDYSCFAVGLDIRNEDTILYDMTGRHEPQKSNKDVTVLLVLNQNVISMPQNLTEVFPNLDRLIIRKSNLINLNKRTLDKLPNLKELDLKRNLIKTIPDGLLDLNKKLEKLDLSENQITVLPPSLLRNQGILSFFAANGNKIAALDRDLFIGTPNIQTILLNNNKISYVHASTFASLNRGSLALTINLKNNTCINDAFSGSSVLNLASALLSLCVEDAPCV